MNVGDDKLLVGVVVAVLLGVIVGYFVYPSSPKEKEVISQQEPLTYSAQLRLDDFEQKMGVLQWRVNGTFFMALASLCLGVWNYFRGLSTTAKKGGEQ